MKPKCLVLFGKFSFAVVMVLSINRLLVWIKNEKGKLRAVSIQSSL